MIGQQPINRVKEIQPTKKVKFKLKNTQSKYKINTLSMDPKLPMPVWVHG